MARTIGLHPTDRYEFKTNAAYRAQWAFLPDKDRLGIIASQLTYLEFHAWLKDNLKHAFPEKPTAEDWASLVFDVDEGFHRTDILLYASVCEAALHAVLNATYQKDTVNAHQALKRCYEKTEDSYVPLNVAQFEMKGAKNPTVGSLCLRKSTIAPVSESELKFVSLIRAGEEVGLYGNPLRLRLDALRDDRNSIHLAQHIRIHNEQGAFTRIDRLEAAAVTEDLRKELEAYVAANP